MTLPESVDATVELLREGRYVCDRALATSLFLALKLGRPLFLEGDAGVGKTEIAKVLAAQLGRRLIRLQCYEGLDLASAAYEWNYSRQMMEIRLAEASGSVDKDTLEQGVFSDRFLVERPLLSALREDPGGADAHGPPVLLIDELDRTDEPFEAFLLEVLSDFQLSIPELGTITAKEPPIVILTSNRTREIHDALKRRCFYHWIDYPNAERERQILAVRVPHAEARLTAQVVAFIQRLRQRDLFKVPGVAESIDWTHALLALDKVELAQETVESTLGVVLKYQDDIENIRAGEHAKILDEAKRSLAEEGPASEG
ncbi:MAG: MoxR family ATPase [Myxococcota bacterium]